MHKFSSYNMLFCLFMKLKTDASTKFTHSKTDYLRQRIRSGVDKILVFLPYKHVQCVKSVLGTWIQWLGFGEITMK